MSRIIHLTLVAATPRSERPLEFLDRLGGHAGVIGGVAEVNARLHPRQDEVRAVVSVCEQPTAVERSRGGDPIGTRRCNRKREFAGEAETDDAHRSTAHERLRRQEIDVGRCVAGHRGGSERSL